MTLCQLSMSSTICKKNMEEGIFTSKTVTQRPKINIKEPGLNQDGHLEAFFLKNSFERRIYYSEILKINDQKRFQNRLLQDLTHQCDRGCNSYP